MSKRKTTEDNTITRDYLINNKIINKNNLINPHFTRKVKSGDQWALNQLELIHETTSFLKSDILKERIFCICNNITTTPICKNENCSNQTKLNYHHDIKGFRFSDYCCVDCSIPYCNNTEETKRKAKQTNLKRYGVDSPSKRKNYKRGIIERLSKKDPSKKLLLDEQWLYEQFAVQKRSITSVSEETGIHWKTLRSHLSDYDWFDVSVLVSDRERDVPLEIINLLYSEQYLIDQHHKNNLSLGEIAKELNVPRSRLYNFFRKFNIDVNRQTYKHTTHQHSKQRHIPKEILQNLDNPKWLKYQHHTLNKSVPTIAEECGVDSQTIRRRLAFYNIERNIGSSSLGECELARFVEDLEYNIIRNDRTIIKPKELDILIPEHNLAIEYCGLIWHSELKKYPSYHYEKYKNCQDKNIQLLTIFEDEWFIKKHLVKQKIKSLLGRDDRKRVFARKCFASEIKKEDKRRFHNQHHLQGDGPGSVNICLTFEQQIVACMSFIKRANNVYILNRYSTSCHVIGGFSKLLSYFKNNFEWNKIETFADLRWSNGNLYEKNNFQYCSFVKPDYYYLDKNFVNRIHKFNFRRKNLPNILEHFDPSLTEKQNCDNNGFLRIWDCGKLKYVLYNNK